MDLKCNHKYLYKSEAERDVTTEEGTGSNDRSKMLECKKEVIIQQIQEASIS